MIEVIRTVSDDRAFLELVALLDAELELRDGADHSFYAQFNTPHGLTGVVMAYDDDDAIGCGGFKEYSPGVAEIKRMFVSPEHRGKRIAAKLLSEIEAWAAELDYSTCILETGFKQPEAIALYRREGYEVVPNYGQYAGIVNSICMKKSI